MVLDPKPGAEHNAMPARKIQHPTSTKFHDEPHPAKRLKIFESTDGDQEKSYDLSGEDCVFTPQISNIVASDDADNNLEDDDNPPLRPTDLESALPVVKTDKDAIAEYEVMKAAEQATPRGLQGRLDNSGWARGKSSIYVDAFNLALETVLEDEGHLFSEKEMEVFGQWRNLEYEAQYL